jgi:serine phosphatase RsbU (regulator of sigma subunit)
MSIAGAGRPGFPPPAARLREPAPALSVEGPPVPADDPSGPGGRSARIRVLLVEDDDADAFLVQELLAEVEAPIDVTWVPSLAEAEPRLDGAQCVLLDLGLPDAQGLSGLRRLREVDSGLAVLVLTGLDDEYLGAEAVAAGAQDYLVKDQVDGRLLGRAIRYAMERCRADESLRQLYEAEARQAENARLERGLLPLPLLRSASPSVTSRYLPGNGRSLLGGDFYDAVETADRRLHVMIGDVCGHGPDEAALGVCLRIAWRTLVLAGHPVDDVLPAVERVLVSERASDEIFATACTLTVEPDRRGGDLRLAGHPAPVRYVPDLRQLPARDTGAPLGVLPGESWPATRVELGAAWTLVLYTDGLIDGKAGTGERLGVDGLLELLRTAGHPGPATPGRPDAADPGALADRVIAAAVDLNGGALVDDVAVMVLSHRAGGAA